MKHWSESSPNSYRNTSGKDQTIIVVQPKKSAYELECERLKKLGYTIDGNMAYDENGGIEIC